MLSGDSIVRQIIDGAEDKQIATRPPGKGNFYTALEYALESQAQIRCVFQGQHGGICPQWSTASQNAAAFEPNAA